MKSIFMVVYPCLVYYGAMFSALYTLELHDTRTPWNLLVAWVLLTAFIVMGTMAYWFFDSGGAAKGLEDGGPPMWRRRLNRVLSVAFGVALVWYGHVFVALVYAVICFVFYLLMAAAREVRETV